MKYAFVSFADVHTRKNVGCCIVQVTELYMANDRCKQLGLMPNCCNNARGYELNHDQFLEQGMELNRFYSKSELVEMGFSLA